MIEPHTKEEIEAAFKTLADNPNHQWFGLAEIGARIVLSDEYVRERIEREIPVDLNWCSLSGMFFRYINPHGKITYHSKTISGMSVVFNSETVVADYLGLVKIESPTRGDIFDIVRFSELRKISGRQRERK